MIYTFGYTLFQKDKEYNRQLHFDVLNRLGIDTIVDVRSVPFLNYCPECNADSMRMAWNRGDTHWYGHMKELGAKGEEEDDDLYIPAATLLPEVLEEEIEVFPIRKSNRPEKEELYDDDEIISFNALRRSIRLEKGLGRLYEGCKDGHIIGLMCSEKSPKDCHRHFIVGESLEQRYERIDVRHIVSIVREVQWQTNEQVRKERNAMLLSNGPVFEWLKKRRGLLGRGEPTVRELDDLCDRYWNLLHGWKRCSINE